MTTPASSHPAHHRRQHHPAIKFLHWLVALLFFLVVPLGAAQKLVGDGTYGIVNAWHMSLGVLLFLLVLVRIGVRLRVGVPPRAADMPRWEARGADVVQLLMYLLLVAEPILGYLTASAKGSTILWLSLVPVWRSDAAADVLLTVHGIVAAVLVILVVLHIGGALLRCFYYRDDTLQSMM